MKKIGIMTWFKHNNYGTVLQAYALQKKINSLGNEAEIINYSTRIRKTMFHEMNFHFIIKKLSYEFFHQRYHQNNSNTKKLFDDFRNNYLNISKECDNHNELKQVGESYDKIVCGSDQIWNPNFFDKHYFLDFIEDSSKKISYAPSIGVSTIEKAEIKDKMSQYLNMFSSISIREEQGKACIKELCSKKVEVVLDPTLLLSKEEWIKLLELKNNKEAYILCYFLGNNKNYVKRAKKISQKLDLPIKVLPTTTLITKFNSDEIIFDCGPKEFVEKIYNSSFVLTDSFHGLIFALNFEKKFCALKRFNNQSNSQNSRIFNILKKFNLEDRIYDNNCYLNQIDFAKVNKTLTKERNNSIAYLKKSLNISNKQVDNKTICSNCTGCGMCASVCPKKCITIDIDEDGFFKYKIDTNKCIKCGLCKKICAQNQNNSKLINNNNKLYSAMAKNKKILNKSSSGGIAYELAKQALQLNYAVVGCTYNYNNNRAEHIIIRKENELQMLSGSKYLQSFTQNAFKEISKIKQGVIIGTPCQIASIDNYLRITEKRNNFILIDLICHGVPSYLLWDKLIKELNIKIQDVQFRNKKYKHKKVLTINSKKINNKKFYNYYDSGLIFNECCYDCNYREACSSDIRIGDFWGKNSKNGISKVLINTKSGYNLFNQIIDNIDCTEENIINYYKNQQKKNVILPIERYYLINELKNKSNTLSKLSSKYCDKIIIDAKIRKRFYKLYKIITKK